MNHKIDITARLQQELPGKTAQYQMASLRRLEELGRLENLAAPPDARVAAVMLLLFQRENKDHLVLIRRTANPHDRHSGQISFPGGQLDPNDVSLEAAALREVQEEIGLNPMDIEVAGQLTELYIPVSNFLVYPFVGIYRRQEYPDFQIQAGEVEEVLTPPLHHFYQPETRKTTELNLASGMLLREVPYFDVQGHVLWGATAMILNEFLSL